MESDPLHKHGRFFDIWSAFYRRPPLGLELRRIQRDAPHRLRIVPGPRVLDLRLGPGDGTSRLAAAGAVAIGLDYSEGMLQAARGANRGRLTRADAGRLPFRDGAFDKLVCTNSFHHYPDHFGALREMRRVLKPGGRVIVLEFSKVAKPLEKAYDLYSFKVLPKMGELIANDADSYRYLAESIRMHPGQEELKQMMVDAGLERVEYFNMTGGVVAVHRGYKL